MKKTIIVLCLLVAAKAQAQDAIPVKGAIAMNLPSKSAAFIPNDAGACSNSTTSTSDCIVELTSHSSNMPDVVACYTAVHKGGSDSYILYVEYYAKYGGVYRYSYDLQPTPDGKYHFNSTYHDSKEETISAFVHDMFGSNCGYIFK